MDKNTDNHVLSNNQHVDVLDYCAGAFQVDPVMLRQSFLLLTRNHFAQPSFFGGDDLPPSYRNFVYSDNDSERVVDIELENTFNPERAQKPTSIFIGVSAVTTQQQVIDSFAGYNADFSASKHVDLEQCEIALSHYAPTADEALQLGMITKTYYQGMRKLIMDRLGLRQYLVRSISRPVFTQQSAGDYHRVDVTIQLAFSTSWKANIESHRLKKVSFDLKPNIK